MDYTETEGQNDVDNMIFLEMINMLDKRKQDILISKYCYGHSDKQIALRLHISRQAVNKHLRQAYILIRENYLEIKECVSYA